VPFRLGYIEVVLAMPLLHVRRKVHLAGLYLKAGRVAPARELLTQAIGTLERKSGPPLARALDTFADVEERMGHTEEAKQWRERAAEIGAAPVR